MSLAVDVLKLLRVRADGLFVVDAASVDADVDGDGDDGDDEDEEKETQERRRPQ